MALSIFKSSVIMIKCNVTVSGIVSKAASCRTNKEGKPFVTFGLQVVIPAKAGINKTIDIDVLKDGTLTEVGSPQVGSRIEVAGTLIPKKRGENFYFNLYSTGINFATDADKDCITGEMEFRGKTGKSIDERTDKKGKPYLQFSAFSAEKVEDCFEYIWVRFFRFGGEREDWLQPGTPIEAKGDMELSVYNGKLNFSCKLAEVKQYIKPPFTPNR